MIRSSKRRGARARFVGPLVVLLPLLAATSVADAAAGDLVIGARGANASQPAQRLTPPAAPSAPASGHFATLPPGSALPSDAACAAAVRPAAERRPDNDQANHTPGVGATAAYPRVTGNFVGTTDEIMQWAACKWGIDEDVVRAQIAKESWWHQSAGGDLTSNPAICYPTLRGQLPCPESVGLGQIRFQYHGDAFANGNAVNSSAYNLDFTYAIWRSCFEGELTWLNTAERNGTYAAGDMWGCLGVWFSGRWHVPGAEQYIAAVQQYMNERVWESPNFQNG